MLSDFCVKPFPVHALTLKTTRVEIVMRHTERNAKAILFPYFIARLLLRLQAVRNVLPAMRRFLEHQRS